MGRRQGGHQSRPGRGGKLALSVAPIKMYWTPDAEPYRDFIRAFRPPTYNSVAPLSRTLKSRIILMRVEFIRTPTSGTPGGMLYLINPAQLGYLKSPHFTTEVMMEPSAINHSTLYFVTLHFMIGVAQLIQWLGFRLDERGSIPGRGKDLSIVVDYGLDDRGFESR
jgi:hypothetical protein